MAKFDAGTAVEAMDYDFTKYGGGEGIVPEPSDEILDEFYSRLASLMAAIKEKVGGLADVDVKDIDKITAALDTLDGDVITGISKDLNGLLAFLTQGSPSEEDIARLPYRVKQAFMGWLVGQLNPESEALASS